MESDAFVGSPIYHVIAILGDSLAVGNGQSINYALDIGKDGRAFQWPMSGASAATIVPANEPLLCGAPQTSKIGAYISFANEYLKRQPPNVRVLLVPCGRGSTGFAKTGFAVWNEGGSDFEAAVTAIIAALAACPSGSSIVGISWRIGSNDTTWADRQTWLALLVQASIRMRARLSAPNAWVTLGQMCPEGIALSHTNNDPIDFAGKNFPYSLANAGFWYGATGSSIDLPHYDAPQERLNGPRHYAVVAGCLSQVARAPGQVPSAPTITGFASTTVSLSWSEPSYSQIADGVAPDPAGFAIAQDYKVEYKIHTDSTWTTFTHTASYGTTITVTGLTASTNYDFRISGVSFAGDVGTASATASQTTAAPVTFSVLDDFATDSTNGVTAVTYVMRITAANVQHVPGNTVTKFKVKVKGSVGRVYIGMATGAAMDASSLTQVLFGGNPSVTQSTSAETTSDEVVLSWNKSTDIIVSVDFTGASGSFCYSNTDGENGTLCNWWQRFGTNEADVADKADGSYGSARAGRVSCMTQLICNGF